MFDENATGWFSDMVKSAVISANRVGGLKARCLYDGSPTQLTDWLKAHSVDVITTSVPFKDELYSPDVIARNNGTAYRPAHACGTYLRLLIPDYTQSDSVLYTDCDVFFDGPITELPSGTYPIRAVPEIDQNLVASNTIFNSGVMLINCGLFKNKYSAIVDILRKNAFFFHGNPGYFDQGVLNIAFQGAWDPLPLEYNWRPYWGVNRKAKIVHYHGPKPHRVSEILSGNRLENEDEILKRMIENNEEAYRFYGDRFRNNLL